MTTPQETVTGLEPAACRVGPERTQLRLGFIALDDCAPLVMPRESSGAAIRDKVVPGLLDGAQRPGRSAECLDPGRRRADARRDRRRGAQDSDRRRARRRPPAANARHGASRLRWRIPMSFSDMRRPFPGARMRCGPAAKCCAGPTRRGYRCCGHLAQGLPAGHFRQAAVTLGMRCTPLERPGADHPSPSCVGNQRAQRSHRSRPARAGGTGI